MRRRMAESQTQGLMEEAFAEMRSAGTERECEVMREQS